MIQSRFFLILCCSILAVACGSGGGSGSNSGVSRDQNIEPDAYGVLIDSKVVGISYRSGDLVGVTDSEGRFGYLEGETIQFFVGDIAVGEAVEPLDKLTPYELSEGDVEVALNIARFLQTLDDDANPENGILITEALKEIAKGKSLQFSGDQWDYDLISFEPSAADRLVYQLTEGTDAGSRNLVSTYDAFSHFSESLELEMNELEADIALTAGDSSCTSHDQCHRVFLPRYGNSYCPLPAVSYPYSELDVDGDLMNSLIQRRNELIGIYDQMEEVATQPISWTGVCISTPDVAILTCNAENKCEVLR